MENIKEVKDLGKMKELIRRSLDRCPIGTQSDNLQHGKDFYKFLFTNYPDLRVYFKGAQNYTAQDIEKSERFEKQGQRILLAMHLVADTVDDPIVFNGYVRETLNRHQQFRMTDDLWLAFFTIMPAFLNTKKPMSNEEMEAWKKLGEMFNREAMSHLKNIRSQA